MKLLTPLLALILGLAYCQASHAAVVALDTGHSPSQPGSRSAYGRPEHGFNVQLAHYVAYHLKARGIGVVRIEGEYALKDRTVGTEKVDLFVSLHHDSIQQSWIDAGKSDQYSGFSVFVSGKNPKFRQSLWCAQNVGGKLAGIGERPSMYHATPIKGENRPLVDEASGVHLYHDLVVLKTSKAPALLVEAGVIANPHEDRRLGDPRVANHLAIAIADGISQCLAHMPAY
jgi:N-acetylmuramoyl-L-alanine amidase